MISEEDIQSWKEQGFYNDQESVKKKAKSLVGDLGYEFTEDCIVNLMSFCRDFGFRLDMEDLMDIAKKARKEYEKDQT